MTSVQCLSKYCGDVGGGLTKHAWHAFPCIPCLPADLRGDTVSQQLPFKSHLHHTCTDAQTACHNWIIAFVRGAIWLIPKRQLGRRVPSLLVVLGRAEATERLV